MNGPPSASAGLFIGAQIDYGKSNAEDNQQTDWLHVDLASPLWQSERCTGFGVSLLCSLLSEHIDVGVAKPH